MGSKLGSSSHLNSSLHEDIETNHYSALWRGGGAAGLKSRDMYKWKGMKRKEMNKKRKEKCMSNGSQDLFSLLIQRRIYVRLPISPLALQGISSQKQRKDHRS